MSNLWNIFVYNSGKQQMKIFDIENTSNCKLI